MKKQARFIIGDYVMIKKGRSPDIEIIVGIEELNEKCYYMLGFDKRFYKESDLAVFPHIELTK